MPSYEATDAGESARGSRGECAREQLAAALWRTDEGCEVCSSNLQESRAEYGLQYSRSFWFLSSPSDLCQKVPDESWRLDRTEGDELKGMKASLRGSGWELVLGSKGKRSSLNLLRSRSCWFVSSLLLLFQEAPDRNVSFTWLLGCIYRLWRAMGSVLRMASWNRRAFTFL